MTDKDILYTMLSREIENTLTKFAPSFRVFADNITMRIIKYIDPYVDLFLTSEKTIDTDLAQAFIDESIDDKMNSFIKKFQVMKTRSSDNYTESDTTP